MQVIIAITGPSHSRKRDMLDGLLYYLHDFLGGKLITLYPERYPDSSVIIAYDFFDVGIIEQGADPRFPEVDPLNEVLRRRCRMIFCPLSVKHGSLEELSGIALRNGYSVIRFEPVREGPIADTWSEREQGPLSDVVRSVNVGALFQLAKELISSHADVFRMEKERTRRKFRETDEYRMRRNKHQWSEHLPSRAYALLDVLEEIEGPSYVWDIGEHFDGEYSKERHIEMLEMLRILAVAGKVRQWRGRWVGV